WNKKVNLISRKDEDRVWQSHILHCVSPLFKIGLVANPTILDLGTGGGMPGIPLKILLPDSEIVLLDSTRKKTMAVQDMINNLHLERIETVWGRAEELSSRGNLVSHFDYIVARAVAPLIDLVKWSVPFLRPSQSQPEARTSDPTLILPPALLALKGGELEDEVSKAKRVRKDLAAEVVNLVFQGSEELSASDKKVVVVRY
ncbi:MAG TPA: 16S rRNA (guanine(527)-N(7))-methyltransferase RsmG, partial [Bacteroidota bacterium]|nr:16S rRNA (guanine(527)-N(7))-methyltransferase RsmG [Bacteroidota bacterium]